MSALLDLLPGATLESPPARARGGTPAVDGELFSQLLDAREVAESVPVPLPLPTAQPPTPAGEPSLAGAALERLLNAPRTNAAIAEPGQPSEPLPGTAPRSDAMRAETADDGAALRISRVALPVDTGVADATPALARFAGPSIGVEARPTVADERRDARGAAGRGATKSALPDALAALRNASNAAGSARAESPGPRQNAASERPDVSPRFEFVNERTDSRPVESALPAHLTDGTSLGAVTPGESTGGRAHPVAASPADAVPTRIAWLAARGGGSARVTLHPAELGEVELSVRVRGNVVDVVITAEQPLARAALLDVSDRFGEALAARELRIESLEIRMTETRGSGLGDPGTGSGSATGRDGAFAQSDHESSTGRDGGPRPAVPETPAAERPAALPTDTAQPAHLDLHV